MKKQEEELQDLHPETMLLSAELLGNLVSLRMPFNVQSVIGNWLMLLGQILLLFNAQQQLQEDGPGNCYSCPCKSKASHNLSNPTNIKNHAIRNAQKLETWETICGEIQETLEQQQQQIDTLWQMIRTLE